MNLTGYVVTVRLSAAGQREFGAATSRQDRFDALVVDEDSLGLWISLLELGGDPTQPEIMLLKWEYCTTVVFDYQPEAPVERARAGFQP